MRLITGRNLYLGMAFSVLFAFLLHACNGADSTGDDASAMEREVLISVHRTEVTDLPIWLESVGQVHSQAAPTLAAEVSGRITRVLADTGDRIEEVIQVGGQGQAR